MRSAKMRLINPRWPVGGIRGMGGRHYFGFDCKPVVLFISLIKGRPHRGLLYQRTIQRNSAPNSVRFPQGLTLRLSTN
jgi:hypothetical protein